MEAIRPWIGGRRLISRNSLCKEKLSQARRLGLSASRWIVRDLRLVVSSYMFERERTCPKGVEPCLQ
jgi:hypothetical protein